MRFQCADNDCGFGDVRLDGQLFQLRIQRGGNADVELDFGLARSDHGERLATC